MSTSNNSITSLIKPPNLLQELKNSKTGKTDYAYPMQTTAWLKMQSVVQTALQFPLSSSDFTALYGSFSDESTVNDAVNVLASINKTAATYGDPTTLISQLPDFENSSSAPKSIYGNGVWLAAQTQLMAQQIAALLSQGLKDIGSVSSSSQRLTDLNELLTGDGGVVSIADALKTQIVDFQTKVSTYYSTLNNELNGSKNSLKSYLGQSSNVLEQAKKDVKTDTSIIDGINSKIHELNKEYTDYVIAASLAPALLLVPVVGILLAIADAATFGALAAEVKSEIESLEKELKKDKVEEQQKAALVTVISSFNAKSQDVQTDGDAFIKTLATMSSALAEFSEQVQSQVKTITEDDVKNWNSFLEKLDFQTALSGWQLIDSKSETFFQSGFVSFSSGS